MKHLLAFGASTTVAALLLMRILPELVAGPEQKTKLEIAKAQIEVSMPNASSEEAPESALPLLLPPPPVPKIPPSPEAKQVAEAPKPSTSISKRSPQALPETVEPIEPAAKAASKAGAADVTISPNSKPVSQAAPAEKVVVKVVPRPRPRPVSKQVVVETRTVAAPSENVETQRDSSPRPDIVSAARSEVQSVTLGPTVEAEGRVLLRILEHGSGPEIEIAWPVSAIQRRALYRLFEACYGMEIAVIDSGGRLYNHTGEAGRPWRLNMDRYSGFVRQPSGRLTLDEKDGIARIRAFHGDLRPAENVRLFPRRLDALLLGGLKALVGESYASAATIRAHYRRDGDMVLVEGIRLDDQPILGRIDLSKAGRSCRPDKWS